MKRYKEYKDSGVEWIGEIPSHWKLNKLKREFEFSVGGTPASGNMEYYTSNEAEGYRWVNISDLNNKVISDTKSYVTLEGIKNTSMNLVAEESLLFSFKLSVGQVAFIEKSMYTNEAIASFSPENNENSLKYLYYAGPIYIVENANENIYGAKILNQELIKNADIVLPPKDEQIKIANYLDKKTSQIDNLISKKEGLIETLKDSRTKLISETVTKGIDKNVPMKDSGVEWIGDIPNHWNIKKLKLLSKIGDGLHGTPEYTDNEKYYFINGHNLGGENINLKENTPTVSYKEYSKHNKSFNKSTILISLNGTVGNVSYYNGEFIMLSKSVGYICINEFICREYLYFYLQSQNVKNYFELSFAGTTIKNLSLETLRNMRIGIPPVEEQENITKYLDKKIFEINNAISKIEEQIEILKKAKQKLITEVVTGKIDVTNL